MNKLRLLLIYGLLVMAGLVSAQTIDQSTPLRVESAASVQQELQTQIKVASPVNLQPAGGVAEYKNFQVSKSIPNQNLPSPNIFVRFFSRFWKTVSNVFKTRHGASQQAIQNLR